jgi:hypothetical protein
VREEREATQDDPRAEQPGPHRQQRELEDAALNERELEWLQQSAAEAIK